MEVGKNNVTQFLTATNMSFMILVYLWLEDEDYLVKSPVRRIHKVKAVKKVKDTYVDEELERMCDSCEERCDLAIDMLPPPACAWASSCF